MLKVRDRVVVYKYGPDYDGKVGTIVERLEPYWRVVLDNDRLDCLFSSSEIRRIRPQSKLEKDVRDYCRRELCL